MVWMYHNPHRCPSVVERYHADMSSLAQDNQERRHNASWRPSADELPGRVAVLDFVRTPFAVRCNAVKVWRPLPADLWTMLSQPGDCTTSKRVERWSLAGVAVMAVMLVAGFSSVGLRTTAGEEDLRFPLLGKSIAVPEHGPQEPGWYHAPGQSLSLGFWVVGPSLAGWAFVRLVWIPMAAGSKPTREATLTLARHFGAVYLYVYVMIVTGAVLMVPLIMLAPKGTEWFRWYLWCFLFGESFFVPAVMWLRLVICDSSGQVFGRHRFAVMAFYLTLFVVMPIIGMIQELD